MTVNNDSGADMWRDYLSRYGETEARGICNRYLDMQIRNNDPEELQFCRELYAAITETPITKNEKPSMLGNMAEKKKTAAQQSVSNKAHERQNEL